LPIGDQPSADPTVAERTTALVSLRGLVKRFGGTEALKRVSCEVMPGEIVALLGENGAGKSTLIKCLAGIYAPNEGQILYRDQPYRHQPPRFGERQPVAFIHQDLGLVEWMTIAENIALATGYPRRAGLIDWRTAERATGSALAQVDCALDPTIRVRDLTRTEKSLVAIARALAVQADVLVLDEPSASLPADEVHRLFAALRPLKARGVGMIYVSHRLDEVFEIADRIVVLRDGSLVGACRVADTTPEALVELIVGKALARFEGTGSAPTGAALPRLAVRGLAVDGAGPIDFTAARAEIVGLVGLRGAGHERIGRALFGALPYRGGIALDGVELALTDPGTAMRAGIGLIARDRVEESTAGGLTIRENTFINPHAVGRGAFALLSPGREAAHARRIGRQVGLRPNAPELPIEGLSGGNQQKVVVGRWLAIGGRVLVAEDPTAGVDVGAKAEIYRLLDAARADGLTVIVVSTDFEEVARLCHRALVFSRGRIVAELAGADLTFGRLVHSASVAPAAADRLPRAA
jgi:ribose transport system ATP-binding protein